MLVRKEAVVEFAIMMLICFLRVVHIGAEPTFSTVRMRTVGDTYGVIVPLPEALRTLIHRRGLLGILCGCGTDSVNAIEFSPFGGDRMDRA